MPSRLDERGRHHLDTHLYGIGKFLEYIYQHFFVIRSCLFLVSIFAFSFGVRFLLWIFVFIEILILWCQFKAPLIDRSRREAFTKWVDESLVTSGGETCGALNAFLSKAYELMLPDYYSFWYTDICNGAFQSIMPSWIQNFQFTKFLFGYRPCRVLQIMAEEEPAHPHSLSFIASCVFLNEIAMEWTFTMFGFDFTFVLTDIVSYGPLRFILESPEESEYLNMGPVSAIGYGAPVNLKVMAINAYINGFNMAKVPMLHYLWILYYEWIYRLMMGDGTYHVNDYVSNHWRFRHLSRRCSQFSEDLFADIAKPSNPKEQLGRFSKAGREIQRWDDRMKMFYDRVAAEEAELAPNEEIIWMKPMPESEIEPVFQYREERPHMTWAETQTDPPR
jgi:hypothetical protein